MGVLLLTHSHERLSVPVVSAHNVPPRREHALNLPVLTVNHLVLALGVEALALAAEVVAASSLGGHRLIKLATVVASDSLSTSTEETFHTVEISSVLRILLRSFLGVIDFALVLEISTIVPKPGLPVRPVLLKRLHLALESVVDALALVHGVVQALGARNRLHGQIGTERHALVNVAGRRQRVGALLLGVVASVGPSV